MTNDTIKFKIELLRSFRSPFIYISGLIGLVLAVKFEDLSYPATAGLLTSFTLSSLLVIIPMVMTYKLRKRLKKQTDDKTR
jgi:hypothetical protein